MQTFTQLSKEIAIELTMLGTLDDNPIWTASLPDDSWHPVSYLKADDGREVRLWFDSRELTPKTRIEISGCWPSSSYDKNYSPVWASDNPPKITVSAKRTPQAIAKDIAGRFLPEFNELWAKALDNIAEFDKRIDSRETKKQTILDAWPSAKLVSHYQERVYLGNGQTKHGGHVEINGYSELRLELRGLTVEQLTAIAQIVEPQ